MKSIALSFLLLAAIACAQESRPSKESTMTDVVTTASGLQYVVLRKGGDGAAPQMGDAVTVHYRGTLADGTEFDSSYKRNEPTTFKIGQVIEGWNEGLGYMTPGAKYKFIIPPKLGYGERATGPIPANATLTFEVELISVAAGPRFTKADPAKQQKTESGIVWQVLKDSEGAAIKDTDVVVIRYAFWNTSGKLLQSSEAGQELKGPVKDMPLPFLKQAPLAMKVGQTARFEAPAAMVFGAADKGPDLPANSVTVWELEVVRVIVPLPVPAFPGAETAAMTKTASGLAYRMTAPGDTTKPKPVMGTKVMVHYAGWLTDGTLFDTSFARGEPTSFMLGQVIQGWNEVLQLMHPGAVVDVVIPANLAYGQRGAGGKIGPNATLVFRIELVAVDC